MNAWIKRVMRFEYRRLLPWVIVLGILAASALLGMQATPRWVVLAGAMVGGVTAFVWLTQHIEWGVLLVIPISFLIPWGLGTGTNTEINLTILFVMLLLGVWGLRMLVLERRVGLTASKVNLPALLFLLVIGLAFVAGNLQWLPFATERASTFSQIGGVLMMVLPVGVMLLTGNVLREEMWLRRMVWLFLWLGALYLAARLLPGGERIAGLFVGKSVSSLFYTWIAAFAGGMLLFNDELRHGRRLGMVMVLAMTVVVGIGLSRENASYWVPALISIGVLAALKWWRVGLLIAMTGGTVLVARYQQIYQFLFGAEEYSTITRAAAWPIMLELVKASPLLGLGPSNYYFATPLFPLLGYYVQFNSHNNFWDLAAQTGLIGLGLFLWIAIALGWIGWKLRKQAVNGFQRGYVHAVVAGLAGTLTAGMLADWFMPFVYNIGFDGFRGAVFAWLFLGGLIALNRINGER
jgi:branched-subunit amino acid transport protein AzlD